MANQTLKRILYNLPEEQMYILQHGTWPRTPCLLTNFLESFDSWGEWCKLLERHHWQWHCYATTQLCFLGSAPCICSLSLAHKADDFSDEQVRWQAWEETAFLHFDIEPNTEDVLWREKNPSLSTGFTSARASELMIHPSPGLAHQSEVER